MPRGAESFPANKTRIKSVVHICLHTNLYFDFVTHCFDADGVIINITQKCVQDDQIGTTLLSILLLLFACHVCRVDGWWWPDTSTGGIITIICMQNMSYTIYRWINSHSVRMP